ncbi:DUF2987 domain-containing protein [Zobellella maritima]|uniref:DUF2987 domain-containing protein n=1 Tax=Zobellella maritima TaxID=2059725 RepID=UPI000E301E27|nr:DUF2987 domain-containing protein [Zobellella maritima]
MKTLPLSILALLLSALPVCAQPLELGYSGFFKHMKTVQKAKVQQAELGFYLSQADGGGLCTIISGGVRVDGEPRGEVTLLPHGQFVLPYDKQLDLDKAVVVLELAEREQCDISIKIQAQLEGGRTALAQLRQVRDEMQTLLAKMAGWPGRYFIPDIQGLHLYPAMGEDSLRLEGMEADPGTGKVSLRDAQLAGEGSLMLPMVRITPWI